MLVEGNFQPCTNSSNLKSFKCNCRFKSEGGSKFEGGFKSEFQIKSEIPTLRKFLAQI